MGNTSLRARREERARLKRVAFLKEQRRIKESEDLANSRDLNTPRLICCFGSQSGTAENFARRLVDKAKSIGAISRLVDLDRFDVQELQSVAQMQDSRTVFCFLVATYGEGEATDNAKKFQRQINSLDAKVHPLRGVQFVVFGLGNKQYQNFNQMGRFVNSRLEELGATQFFAYGEGDDSDYIEKAFTSWQKSLLSHIELQVTIKHDPCSQESDGRSNSGYNLEWIEKPLDSIVLSYNGRFVRSMNQAHAMAPGTNLVSRSYFKTEPFKVLGVRKLCSDDGNNGYNVLHVELELPVSIETYGTADNISIIPENSASTVEKVASILGWQDRLDAWFKIKAMDMEESGELFPTPCTLRTALESYCSLHSIIDVDFIEKMIPFCSNTVKQEQLKRLIHDPSSGELRGMTETEKVSIQEFLERFAPFDFKDPLGFLLLCPRMQPRDYTISSSNKSSPRVVHLTMTMIKETLPGNREFRGVLTDAMHRRFRCANDQAPIPPVFAYLKKSSFTLPASSETPLILVGPGTGVAPMRALVQERGWQKSQGMTIGKCLLFFGCRTSSEYLYKDEMESFLSDGVITSLNVAFSREERRIYVHTLIDEFGAELWSLLHASNAYLYICGSTSMGKGVQSALINIAMKYGNMDNSAAEEYLSNLTKNGRLSRELWS